MTSNEPEPQAKIVKWRLVLPACRSGELSVREWCCQQVVLLVLFEKIERKQITLVDFHIMFCGFFSWVLY